MTLQERFIRNLRRFREDLNWTQEQLGSAMGSDRTVIGRYERSSSRMNLERADELARALGVDVRALLESPTTGPIVRRPPGGPVSSRQVGAKVKMMREAEGITQQELGERIGMDRNHISRIEAQGDNVAALQLSTLERLAAALRVKPVDLL
ncbi:MULTISPECIES: helix-turn-helix transcriptional regulator [unclassified Caballeronia]|uniref:helix-turn-helix domain-containing protein n=1 Tax=unclassified Caballeronia TaxID=2646786 RepID=UPI0028623035|nr:MULTISPECIES: helix-turn-helix transcriptional regulator [unclassified Caballeronia]MDR5751360.1 helix-turn-helix transcriptional regulator [Caballeronia sp. LZ024]MDR5844498.1 helix-turn-helix transcriptional regulator [Caballeronia sp. LZ031]